MRFGTGNFNEKLLVSQVSQKIALIGFGTVGRGLVEILEQKREFLRDSHGYEPRVVAVSDI